MDPVLSFPKSSSSIFMAPSSALPKSTAVSVDDESADPEGQTHACCGHLSDRVF
ncbi:hypothetical protein ACNQR7_31760 [Mycolicibacterium senegalense]|uniref:hypothetical protein n=1 Tax=Mycolicibacterium senegalense TaxID=1796 RepID=UPI003AAB1AD9